MVTYLLKCTVCANLFASGETWTRHLYLEEHQAKAREECAKWEGTRKACALVAFFSRSISKKKEENGSNLMMMLWDCMKKNAGGVGGCGFLITDFIWWRERKTMAVLQFESQKTAEQVYDHLMQPRKAAGGKSGVQVGNYFVQVKRLVDILDLEWKALRPAVNAVKIQDCRAAPSEPVGTLGRSLAVKKRKKNAVPSTSSTPSSSSSAKVQVNKLGCQGNKKVNKSKKKKGLMPGNKDLKGAVKIEHVSKQSGKQAVKKRNARKNARRMQYPNPNIWNKFVKQCLER